MKLEVSQEAANWFIHEMDLVAGDSIRFFGKVYGTRDGFSFALAKMEPSRSLIETMVDGVRFYIEKADEWFFSEIDLNVTFNPERNEPEYHYTER